jgi:putative nucleotidyltransferase with HDIG domain
MLVSTIRDYVHAECQREGNPFGADFFEQHVLVVADYGERIARQLNADSEIVAVSAYLHDISVIQDSTTLPVHNVRGAEIAVQYLTGLSYSPEAIEMVRGCIVSHTCPLQIGEGTLEEVCLSNADAASQIAKFPYFLYYSFIVRKLSYGDGKEWLRVLLERNWNKMIEPARNMVKREYLLAKDCLAEPA